MRSADLAAVPAALALALILTGQSVDALGLWLYPLVGAAAILIFSLFGLYRSVVRFMGLDLVVAAARSTALVTVCLLLIAVALLPTEAAARLAICFGVVTLVYVAGSRFAVRIALQNRRVPRERTIIYGAGAAGARLASAVSSDDDVVPVAFVDDSRSLVGSVVQGLEVYDPESLPELIGQLGVTRVLLAMPSASRRRRRAILKNLERLPIRVQTVPDVSDILSGKASVEDVRDVEVADLLGRDPVPPNNALLSSCVADKSVLVTGAGGSIGSELCRQIVSLKPRVLIYLDISEAALYQIDQDLKNIAARGDVGTQLVPLIGSTHHQTRMLDVMTSYEVDTVYHAAAYKHVPIVEHNMLEGVHNNVFGTLHAAEAAAAAGVSNFVLVSTDKAVSPTNVMGATKRLSEIILQGLDERGNSTIFSMVRFGNVLASSGSVVPLFREQIRNGGPVTVTHPDIIRYFMTIPEAAQLVIQAGAMATGGDVFVLDMGKPVRIKHLAERMIHLMGLSVRDEEHPDGDIEIQYTGLRPAEKLYEELLIGSNVMGTEHSMIMRAEEDYLPWPDVSDLLGRLWAACQERDCEDVRALLLEAVAGYTPPAGLEDLVWQRRQQLSRRKSSPATVTPLQPRSTH